MKALLIETLQKAIDRWKITLWLVGGPVRDELLGRSYDDWDMVCRSANRVAHDVSKRLRAKCITLDEQHKIYRVILPESFRPIHTLDFAELQGRTIEDDLKRRDFTINAMARRLGANLIIDPLGGQKDLKKKVIRAVAEKAFPEDPLRLVRAFRFAAQFHFTIESRTLGWIKKYHESLSKVAAERIREELLRIWKQPDMHAILRLMDRVQLLSVIFPEVEACRRTALRYYGKGGVLTHSLETVENLEWLICRSTDPSTQLYLQTLIGGFPRSAWLKWAAFLHDIGKPATARMLKGRLRFFQHEHVGATLTMAISQRLRCSRHEVHLMGLWVRNHMRTGGLAAAPQITDKALSRFFRDLGEEGIGMVLLSLADHYTYLKKSLWQKRKDPVEKMAYRLLSSYFEKRSILLPAKVVDGHHLMKTLRLKPGPIIGRLLEEIQDAQAEGKVATREQALTYARKRLRVVSSARPRAEG